MKSFSFKQLFFVCFLKSLCWFLILSNSQNIFFNPFDVNKHFISIDLIKFIYKIVFFQSIINIFFHNRFFIFFVFLLVL